MKCGSCGSDMEKGFTTDVTEDGDCVYIVRNVPCYKCTECGEIFYSAETVRKLEKIVDSLKNSAMQVSIAEFSKAA